VDSDRSVYEDIVCGRAKADDRFVELAEFSGGIVAVR
jgi:hypothetical protein